MAGAAFGPSGDALSGFRRYLKHQRFRPRVSWPVHDVGAALGVLAHFLQAACRERARELKQQQQQQLPKLTTTNSDPHEGFITHVFPSAPAFTSLHFHPASRARLYGFTVKWRTRLAACGTVATQRGKHTLGPFLEAQGPRCSLQPWPSG